jgi:hypothetical protein
MSQVPQVTKQEVENFAKIWTYRGLAIPMKEEHIQFAADFANVMLVSFVRMCQENMAAMVQKAQEAAKPQIITEG